MTTVDHPRIRRNDPPQRLSPRGLGVTRPAPNDGCGHTTVAVGGSADPTRTRLEDGVLAALSGPHDLRPLTLPELTALAAGIRRHLVRSVAATGGHLGSNLGVVELSIALHRVFDSPVDKILFDTGHQAYVHKIVTGRGPDFTGLRQHGGLSGYPARRESPHDHMENSHASTALSYADGLANAARLRGEAHTVVAVVGDGALTGGMCWEALNNLGAGGLPVVVVLNDNTRSYEPTVGAIAAHLATLRDAPTGGGARPWSVFEQLGFDYLGPVDGHDIAMLETVLTAARDRRRPVLVHCVTSKGKGYLPAEQDETDRLHGVGVVDPATGKPATAPAPTWTSVFEDAIAELAASRPDLVAITAAMKHPVGLARFAREHPDRVFDVGMAEQHAVTSAAGLAMGGLRPVVAVYATFLNRAFDQVLLDVALHRLPVTFVLDRAGITGPDGASHHGMWDLSMLATVPGLRVACPRDPARLRALLAEAVAVTDGPTALRFPKASIGPDIPSAARVGTVDVLRAGSGGRARAGSAGVLLVAVGATAAGCLAAADRLAAEGIAVTVADPRWALPVCTDLTEMAAGFDLVCTVEDGTRSGGVGDAVARACADHGVTTPVRTIGLPHQFIQHGSREQLLAESGLNDTAILTRIKQALDDVRRNPC